MGSRCVVVRARPLASVRPRPCMCADNLIWLHAVSALVRCARKRELGMMAAAAGGGKGGYTARVHGTAIANQCNEVFCMRTCRSHCDETEHIQRRERTCAASSAAAFLACPTRTSCRTAEPGEGHPPPRILGPKRSKEFPSQLWARRDRIKRPGVSLPLRVPIDVRPSVHTWVPTAPCPPDHIHGAVEGRLS